MKIHLPDEIKHYEPELRVFIDAMVYKLVKNAHKGKWEDAKLNWLYERLIEEITELSGALKDGSTVGVLLETADVANFAMMMAVISVKGTEDPFKEVGTIRRDDKKTTQYKERLVPRNG